MKVVVTGGCGFIGSNFVKLLHAKRPNYEITVVDKLSYASNISFLKPVLKSKHVKFAKLDITNAKQVNTFFKNHKTDIIVHFAAETHVDNSIACPEPFVATNVVGTFNLLNATKSKKFIHVSTDEVYGFLTLQEKRKFKETDKLDPTSVYSSTKAASDLIALSFYKTYGSNVVVTRCCNNFGPNQHTEKFIPTIIKSILSETPVPVYGKGINVREWIYVVDHCEMILSVLENGKHGEIYNIGSSVEMQNIDLVKMIGKYMLAKKYVSKFDIKFVKDRLGHDLRYAIDSTKVRRLSNYKPLHTFEDNIKSTVDWYYDIL